MKIYIAGNNTYNYGTAMLSINLIYYLSKKGNFDFYCDTKNSKDNLRLEKMSTLDVKRITINGYRADQHFITRSFYFGFDPFRLSYKISNEFDSMIFLAGDSLSEYYSIPGLISHLLNIGIISRRIPTFLIGQTVGPFTSWRKKYAKFCLKNCYIYTRDHWTYTYLKYELGLNYVYTSSDLALLDLPMQNNSKKKFCILEEYDLKENEYITIIPSGLYEQYTKNFDAYVESWINIIKKLLDHKITNDRKILLLAHVLESDKDMINYLSDKANLENNSKVVLATREMFPQEARILLGNGLLTITGRMHGAISTLQMKKPAISLSYGVKFQGVIGDKLELPELIIESSGDKVWEDKRMSDVVIKKINHIIDNYNDIITKIDKNIELSKKEVLFTIDDVANKLRKKCERKETSN